MGFLTVQCLIMPGRHSCAGTDFTWLRGWNDSDGWIGVLQAYTLRLTVAVKIIRSRWVIGVTWGYRFTRVRL